MRGEETRGDALVAVFSNVWLMNLSFIHILHPLRHSPHRMYQPGERVGGVSDRAVQPAEGRTTRGDQGHLMLREHIVPQPEVIRAI